jgi:hypothetical protein
MDNRQANRDRSLNNRCNESTSAEGMAETRRSINDSWRLTGSITTRLAERIDAMTPKCIIQRIWFKSIRNWDHCFTSFRIISDRETSAIVQFIQSQWQWFAEYGNVINDKSSFLIRIHLKFSVILWIKEKQFPQPSIAAIWRSKFGVTLSHSLRLDWYRSILGCTKNLRQLPSHCRSSASQNWFHEYLQFQLTNQFLIIDIFCKHNSLIGKWKSRNRSVQSFVINPPFSVHLHREKSQWPDQAQCQSPDRIPPRLIWK